MIPKLPSELAAAIDANGQKPFEVEHPNTHATYFVVDGETHRQAMEALRRQRQQDDLNAIAEGIEQMERGEGIPIAEARERSKQRILSRDS